MAIRNTKHINLVEVSFYEWTHEFPNTRHPLDDRRGYSFVKTIVAYKKTAGRWLHRDYFMNRCFNGGVREETTYHFYEILSVFCSNDFRYSTPLKRVERWVSDDECSMRIKYLIEYVDNGELKRKEVDERAFENINSLKRAKSAD